MPDQAAYLFLCQILLVSLIQYLPQKLRCRHNFAQWNFWCHTDALSAFADVGTAAKTTFVILITDSYLEVQFIIHVFDLLIFQLSFKIGILFHHIYHFSLQLFDLLLRLLVALCQLSHFIVVFLFELGYWWISPWLHSFNSFQLILEIFDFHFAGIVFKFQLLVFSLQLLDFLSQSIHFDERILLLFFWRPRRTLVPILHHCGQPQDLLLQLVDPQILLVFVGLECEYLLLQALDSALKLADHELTALCFWILLSHFIEQSLVCC